MNTLYRLCCLTITGLLFSSLNASAAVNQRITGTWNMQGGTAGGIDSSKWTSSVAAIMNRGGFSDQGGRRHPIDVLALQEASIPPREELATIVQQVTRPGASPANNMVRQNTEAVRNHYVYYTEVASRVNTAIVSRQAADEIILFPVMRLRANGQPSPTARPTLGIRIGDDYFFFTVHAGSMNDGDTGNRNEAPQIIEAIEQYMATVVQTRPRTSWIIMGDFNRTPTNLQRNLQAPAANIMRDIVYLRDRTCRNACAATQTSGHALDFAVVGGGPTAPNFLVLAGSFLIASAFNHMSDHIAIRFRPAGM